MRKRCPTSTICHQLGVFPRSILVHPDNWEGPHTFDAAKLEHIRQRLASFETMTWKQIIGRDNHPIHTGDICAGAQKRLEALQINVETIVSLRCTNRERIWGIRRENVLPVNSLAGPEPYGLSRSKEKYLKFQWDCLVK